MASPTGAARPELDSLSDSGKKRSLRMVAVLLAGIYSWTLTVLPVATTLGVGLWTVILAGAALLSLLVAPFLPSGRWSIVAALDLYIGFCVLCWWTGPKLELGGISGVFGSLGWLAYTLALGSLSTPSDGPIPPSLGPELEPRSPPRRLPVIALLVCIAGVIVLLSAAWQVERPAVAVFAHIVALAVALFLLRGGAHLSGYFQTLGTRLQRPLTLRRALAPLLFLALWIALGVSLRYLA